MIKPARLLTISQAFSNPERKGYDKARKRKYSDALMEEAIKLGQHYGNYTAAADEIGIGHAAFKEYRYRKKIQAGLIKQNPVDLLVTHHALKLYAARHGSLLKCFARAAIPHNLKGLTLYNRWRSGRMKMETN